MSKSVLLKPRMSEKAYGLTQAKNVYVFDVDPGLNKHTVARSVAEQFDVSVISVNMAKVKGKAKRTIAKKGRKVYSGREALSKKAYVTLKQGQTLPFFEAAEQEAEKDQAKQEKLTAAMEKQTEKEAKKQAKTGRRGLRRQKESE
jgi:ribosomal protein L23